MTNDAIEALLLLMQFAGGCIFLVACVKSTIYASTLPSGPMRWILSRLALGFGIFALMAVNWIFEDVHPLLDSITDVLYVLALICSMWGFFGLLRLKLDI